LTESFIAILTFIFIKQTIHFELLLSAFCVCIFPGFFVIGRNNVLNFTFSSLQEQPLCTYIVSRQLGGHKVIQGAFGLQELRMMSGYPERHVQFLSQLIVLVLHSTLLSNDLVFDHDLFQENVLQVLCVIMLFLQSSFILLDNLLEMSLSFGLVLFPILFHLFHSVFKSGYIVFEVGKLLLHNLGNFLLLRSLDDSVALEDS